MRINVEKQRDRSLVLQNRRRKAMVYFIRRREPSEANVRLVKDLEERTKTTSVENARDSWHAPVCQNYKTESGCKFGDKCAFLCTESMTISPKKKNGQIGGEGSVAMLKKSKQLGCVFQDVEPPEFNSISRKGPKSLGPKRSVQFSKKKITPRENSGNQSSV